MDFYRDRFADASFTGDGEFSLEESMVIGAMAGILQTRLRERLLEELGGTYGVGVSGSISYRPDEEYRVGIQFGSDPRRAEELSAAVFEEIERLKDDGPDAEVVDNTREAQRRSMETSLVRNNPYWLGPQPESLVQRQHTADQRRGHLCPDSPTAGRGGLVAPGVCGLGAGRHHRLPVDRHSSRLDVSPERFMPDLLERLGVTVLRDIEVLKVEDEPTQGVAVPDPLRREVDVGPGRGRSQCVRSEERHGLQVRIRGEYAGQLAEQFLAERVHSCL